MSSKRLETIKLTARFRLDRGVDENLLETYKTVVKELLDYAYSKGVTSFGRLKAEKYPPSRRPTTFIKRGAQKTPNFS